MVLPEVTGEQRKHRGLGGVLERDLIWRTMFLWLGYASFTSAFYCADTWYAKIVTDASGDPQLAIVVGMLIASGRVPGALIFAVLATKIKPRIATVLIVGSRGLA
ncbi:hypothetical protein GOZ80_18270 [Agrobacterium vitis]|uniref:MFS transporter n=1 Tax=Agrobacterium vitis TaxID=373 RepID=A0AAE4X153_AGRVI|nr:hypothetical protein [Agrobacterium vitis]MBF2714117.1 hypothetical protein [Agrobacterium vitis]MUO81496.1 hypothetical protein [Agrobacterium vitis]MUO95857.1 hypothetical protein [Agrobacterium vitis]MVA93936.1 hypothetical protein [Agrobacterium vitis]MVB03557.1 hypothetical protein [Agrobacterium vitis]